MTGAMQIQLGLFIGSRTIQNPTRHGDRMRRLFLAALVFDDRGVATHAQPNRNASCQETARRMLRRRL